MIDEILLHVNLLVIMAKKLIVTPTIYKLSMHLLKMMMYDLRTCLIQEVLGAITITCTISNVMLVWFSHVLKS